MNHIYGFTSTYNWNKGGWSPRSDSPPKNGTPIHWSKAKDITLGARWASWACSYLPSSRHFQQFSTLAGRQVLSPGSWSPSLSSWGRIGPAFPYLSHAKARKTARGGGKQHRHVRPWIPGYLVTWNPDWWHMKRESNPQSAIITLLSLYLPI